MPATAKFFDTGKDESQHSKVMETRHSSRGRECPLCSGEDMAAPGRQALAATKTGTPRQVSGPADRCGSRRNPRLCERREASCPLGMHRSLALVEELGRMGHLIFPTIADRHLWKGSCG